MSQILDLIFNLVDIIFMLFNFALIIYILMSWIPGSRDSTFGVFLAGICEPYLEPFRKIIPPIGMLDISPIVAIIALHLASSGLWSLYGMLV